MILLRYLHLRLYVLAAFAFASSHAPPPELVRSIARTCAVEAPLYAVDAGGERTAIRLVVAAVRESSMKGDAVGDGGASYGYFQIFHRPDLVGRPDAEAREALRQMRVSLAMCGDPYTAYLSGRCRGAGAPESAVREAARRETLALRMYSTLTMFPFTTAAGDAR